MKNKISSLERGLVCYTLSLNPIYLLKVKLWSDVRLFGLVNDYLIGNLLFSTISVDILKTTAVDKIPTDLEGMEASMERLLALIDDVYKYVDNVVVRFYCFCCPASATLALPAFHYNFIIIFLSGRAHCTR